MTDTDTQLADRYADELDRLPDDRREEFLALLIAMGVFAFLGGVVVGWVFL